MEEDRRLYTGDCSVAAGEKRGKDVPGTRQMASRYRHPPALRKIGLGNWQNPMQVADPRAQFPTNEQMSNGKSFPL